MTSLTTIDLASLQLPLAAMAFLATVYLCLKIRGAIQHHFWKRGLAEENRLRKM